MLKKIKKLLFHKFAIFLVIFAHSLFFLHPANAQVSDSEIIKEIEKTLIFDDDSREQLDFYNQQNSSQKSLNLHRTDSIESPQLDGVDIIVTNPKKENLDIRERERLAYNSALIEQYEVAIELYKQVIAAEPNNSYAKFALAVVYQKVGQFRQAKAIYYQMLKSNPEKRQDIIGNLLAILIDESPRDALYLLSRLTVQNPKSAFVLAQAAIAYDKVKNYDQALSLLNRAVTIEPDNISYKYNLAVIYDKTLQYDKAIDFYSDIAKNYSDNNQIAPREQIVRRIETLRGKL